MRNYHKLLVRTSNNKTVGNHRVEFDNFVKGRRNFYYHGHLVCRVDDLEKTYLLDDCGWGGAISTKHCLAGYREYFNSLGYKQINPEPIYSYEYNKK